MRDYPDIMIKYDIRDQYELHNLLRKIIPEGSYHGFHCGRMPDIQFGKFDRDAAITSLLMDSAPISKTDFADLISDIYGYDPDGKLLEAIERNAVKAGNKDSAYLNTICDAVYSICRFMGRPAWNKKGKQILKSFMGAGYSFNTRTYARDTLKKIISLEL